MIKNVIDHDNTFRTSAMQTMLQDLAYTVAISISNRSIQYPRMSCISADPVTASNNANNANNAISADRNAVSNANSEKIPFVLVGIRDSTCAMYHPFPPYPSTPSQAAPHPICVTYTHCTHCPGYTPYTYSAYNRHYTHRTHCTRYA